MNYIVLFVFLSKIVFALAQILLSKLRVNPRNPRVITEQAQAALALSLENFPEMLAIRPIVVDEDFTVLGGNQRTQIMQRWDKGPPESWEAAGVENVTFDESGRIVAIPADWVYIAEGLTPAQKKEFIAKDNASAGDFDWEILMEDYAAEQLAEWGLEVEWKDPEEVVEDRYEIPQPDEITTDFVPGDLITIGPHRLLCGDSTNADDVERLLAGNKPLLMVTDPPYGVEYDPTWRGEFRTQNSKAKLGAVENDDRVDWSAAWALSPSVVAYVWHAGRYAREFQEALEKNRFEIRSQIIWVKERFALSRGTYHWQHEPCWFAIRDEGGPRSLSGTPQELIDALLEMVQSEEEVEFTLGTRFFSGARLGYYEDHTPLWFAVKKGSKGFWRGGRSQSTTWEISAREDAGHGHGTQKPLECMARPIRNHEGDVYEPFCGSGTTMLAGHQLGRKVYAMEISPKYCQIIVNRMLDWDATLPVKVNGKPYQPKTENDGNE